MTGLLLAFAAGMVTLLNPCVLPLLPIIIGSALQADRRAPLALALGLSTSFTLFGVLIVAFGYSIGLEGDHLRYGAGALLAISGLVLLIPPAQQAFSAAMSPLVSGGHTLLGRISGTGLASQFAIGALLGLVWTPCVGPTLGAAIAVASQRGDLGYSFMTFGIFSLGVSASLLLFAYGSRATLGARKQSFRAAAKWAKPALGAALLLVGVLIFTGLDKILEELLLDLSPAWLIDLTTRF